MNNKFKIIHTVTQEVLNKNPKWNMPYVPAIKVLSGKPLYISGVNAAPIYHSHPHDYKEFDQLDFSPESQARLTMENLKVILEQAGGTLSDIVQIFIFIVNVQQNGEKILKLVSSFFGVHLCSSTVAGVTDLITDPRLILEISAVAYL